MPNAPPKAVTIDRAFASEFRSFGEDQVCVLSGPSGFKGRMTTGGIYHPDGALEPLAERVCGRGDRVLSLSPNRLGRGDLRAARSRLPGRTVYLGYFMNHYGHFLTEFLSRLWFIETHAAFDHYACFPYVFDAGALRPTGAHRYFLERLGVSLDDLVILREPLDIEQLFVPEQLWTVNRPANAALLPVYQRIRGPHVGAKAPDRVFLSRIPASGSGPKGYSRVRNVAEVEEVFRTRGFDILYPEVADIRDQMDVYANAAVIASFSGSALHNCVFFQQDALMIELGDTRCPDGFHPMQAAANELSGLRARHVPFDGGPSGRHDVERLGRALDNILAQAG